MRSATPLPPSFIGSSSTAANAHLGEGCRGDDEGCRGDELSGGFVLQADRRCRKSLTPTQFGNRPVRATGMQTPANQSNGAMLSSLSKPTRARVQQLHGHPPLADGAGVARPAIV